MKTLTRVEKYRKLREEIARMPDDGALSNVLSSSITSKIIRLRSQESIGDKDPKSTIEYGIDDLLEGVENLEDDVDTKVSPIDVQKRKELIRVIILISILIILLVGVVVLGIYAF